MDDDLCVYFFFFRIHNDSRLFTRTLRVPNLASSRSTTSLFDRCLCAAAKIDALAPPTSLQCVCGTLQSIRQLIFERSPLSTNLNGQTGGLCSCTTHLAISFFPQTRVFVYYHYRDHITAQREIRAVKS